MCVCVCVCVCVYFCYVCTYINVCPPINTYTRTHIFKGFGYI